MTVLSARANFYMQFKLIFLLLSFSSGAMAAAPLKPIESLDVPRYMGRWYEIAKYPNWFQRHCAKDTVAEYRLLAGGDVEVTNRCTRKNGDKDQATGSARQIGASTSLKLQVRFAPQWLAFLPFVWGDYWIIDLDPDYQLVAVSEPSREYLWVLSRTPRVAPAVYDALMHRLRAQGFDTTQLEKTPQGN
jgi:apolipoprotein D and lipocalin family protein